MTNTTYSIHGFEFSSVSEITKAIRSSPNLCDTEQKILDRMMAMDLDIDNVYGTLSQACVDYYLDEDAEAEQEDELLGEAYADWQSYTLHKTLPASVQEALLFSEDEDKKKEALRDFEA